MPKIPKRKMALTKKKLAKENMRHPSVRIAKESRSGGQSLHKGEEVATLPAKACDKDSYVALMGGITHNVGDMNFVKFDVTAMIPCKNSQKARDAAFAEASKFVHEKIKSELQKAQNDHGKEA